MISVLKYVRIHLIIGIFISSIAVAEEKVSEPTVSVTKNQENEHTQIREHATKRPRTEIARVPKLTQKRLPTDLEKEFKKLTIELRSLDDTSAADSLQRFVDQHPRYTLARLWLIRTLLNSNRINDALAAIDETKLRQSQDTQISFWKTNVYIQSGKLVQATGEIERSLDLGLQGADVWIQKAVREQQAGNHGGAVMMLRLALKAEPQNPLVHLNLGYSFEHLSQIEQAIAAYQGYIIYSGEQNKVLKQKILERLDTLFEFTNSIKTDERSSDILYQFKSLP